MKKILAVMCILCTCAASVAEDKTVYRDAQGRNMGSASTDRYGKTTYRDSMGRTQGSSTSR